MLKRIISALIGIPIAVIIIVFANTYIFDVAIAIIALIAMYEYFNSFDKEKHNKNLRWIGYLSAILIAFLHIIPGEYMLKSIIAIIPVSILVLFLQIIATEMKYNINDIAIVLFGIFYIVIFLMFVSLIRETDNGKILIWFIFLTAWGTDIFAYFIGRKFGKHKFTKISPNKSIEGCIAGVVGAIICVLVYTIVCNNLLNTNFNYYIVTIITLILSIIGQIGDLAASSIKRYTGIKDFGNLIPGHGGMLDRFDSVIFIAPFAYFLLTLI